MMRLSFVVIAGLSWYLTLMPESTCQFSNDRGKYFGNGLLSGIWVEVLIYGQSIHDLVKVSNRHS
jgi:hypothetical protein